VRPDISYREALALQDLVWNVAWAGLTEDICGMEVLPFTPLHFVRLASARSPFVCGGGNPSQQDVDNFLWATSPLYDPQSRCKKFRHWLNYFRVTRKLTLAALVAGIDEYMDEAWQDSPAKSGREGKAYYAGIVSMMKAICPAYNMTPQQVMVTPYKCLFQLAKPVCVQWGLPITAPAELAFMRDRARARATRTN
jgi:hypothetical protein